MKSYSKNYLFSIMLSFLVVSCSKEQKKEVYSDSGQLKAASAVTWYLTNKDGSAKFTQQTSLGWSTTKNRNATITVNTGTTYQTIDGFGFCLTEGSAEVISSLSSTVQSSLLNELFSTTSGLGISVLRISIGASDLSSSDYSYDEVSSGTDVNLANFTLSGPDLTYIVPLLKQILAINPNIKILATPWTPPTWMKSNGTWVGGNLLSTYYSSYANYFVKYIAAMAAQGINIWAITPQNEPENPNNNPSMVLDSISEGTFINTYLGPALKNAGYSTKIICYDHNCDDVKYPESVISRAGTYVDGSAFHLYAGSISALTTVHNFNPSKNVYFTEQYTSSTGSFSGDFPWHMNYVMIGSTANWAKIALEWNLATNSSYGPYTSGGCTTCQGAVTVTGSSSFTRNVSYYIVAHMSKFVTPGSVRVNSTSTNSNLVNVAFTSGTNKVVVVLNNNRTSTTFNISYGGSWITPTLAAGSAATFVWQ